MNNALFLMSARSCPKAPALLRSFTARALALATVFILVPGISTLWPAPHPADVSRMVKVPTGQSTWTVEVTKVTADSVAGKSSNAGAGDIDAPKVMSSVADKDKAAAKANGVLPTKIDVTQDSEKRRCIVHWTNGKTREVWDIPKLAVILSEAPNGSIMASRDLQLFAVPFVSNAFDWMKPGFLQDKEPKDFKGKLCYHYKGDVPTFNMKGEPEAPVTMHAWIDSTTLLPVGLHDGTCLGLYTFGPGEGELTLPPKFQAKMDYYVTVMGGVPSHPAAKRTNASPALVR